MGGSLIFVVTISLMASGFFLAAMANSSGMSEPTAFLNSLLAGGASGSFIF